MTGEEYLLIDKTIIAQGCSYDFSIYCSTQGKKNVKCVKEKGLIVDTDDLFFFDKSGDLYVNKSDYNSYKSFYRSTLFKSARELNQRKNTIAENDESESIGNPISFTEKVEVVYQNASKALNELFSNPDALVNYKESKKVVNDLVDSVMDDDFTLKSLMCIATHDYYTHTHSINVAIYSLSLGTFLGYSTDELKDLGEAALLHDLGKSKINSKIINKNGKLTQGEFEVIKRHPVYGAKLGMKLGIKNKRVLDGIKYHHEKIDGTGYPSGLYKNEIPVFAQIIGVCDIFDALTSQRSYKKAMTSFEALKLMKVEMSSGLDIKILNNMIKMFK